MKIHGSDNTIFENNVFDSNHATDWHVEEMVLGKTGLNRMRDFMDKYYRTLRGGAVYVDNQLGKCKVCKVTFQGKNIFRNNFAFIQGGAISYRSMGFQNVNDSLVFINNTDLFQNKSVSSYANSVRIKFLD